MNPIKLQILEVIMSLLVSNNLNQKIESITTKNWSPVLIICKIGENKWNQYFQAWKHIFHTSAHLKKGKRAV